MERRCSIREKDDDDSKTTRAMTRTTMIAKRRTTIIAKMRAKMIEMAKKVKK